MSNLLVSYLEVIRAAQQKTHFEDFKTGGRLASDIKKGYEARMVAFRELALDGFVLLESGCLVLGELTPTPWLTDAIQNGSSESWEICDLFPTKLRKFNPDNFHLQEIGLAGELFVIESLQQHLNENQRTSIEHTSLTDDSAGFDIACPSLKTDEQMFFEVKTSTRAGDNFVFHLTRNEWNTAVRKPNWYLVLVKRVDGEHRIFGYLDGQSLVTYYPKDSHEDFQWSNVIGRLGSDDIFSGLPGF